MSMPQPDRTALPLDVSSATNVGAAGTVTPGSPPPGAPNVVVILLDDMGFGASSPYGGPCDMPTADRLASGGLRYSRFHVTALCSPTRQALLTGRNHHSVGMGVTSEMATSEPGYSGYRPASAATLAQLLQGNGYSTAAFGKWHQTPPSEVSPSGPFTRWPTGEGFDRFYGFMGAEMNHWYPQLFDGTTPVEPTRTPEQGYHLTEDLVDHAVDWIQQQHALTPSKPFFCYLALGATHAPFHVSQAWQEAYAGRFDKGWDVQREETLTQQRDLGIVPADTDLAPWPEEVPRWEELSPQARKVATRFMESYAGFATHADHHVGRLIEVLAELESLDNTLLFYLLGDNGASGEGGIEGTLREHLVGHGYPDDTAEMAQRLDEFGSPTTYGMYPVGWALAMNTPYPWTKQVASHFGGVRDGMIVHWPDGIAAQGEIRHQFHHVIDIVPTVLQAAGLPQPRTVNGVAQQRIEGVSMRYSFADADAADQRQTQYFEMVGNRGIYHDGWSAVARHGVPWKMTEEPRPFDEDRWELYNLRRDWSQSHDIAAEQPQRLAELKQLFDEEANRYHVFPLDDRVTERENPALAGRIDLHHGRDRITLGPTTSRLTEEVAPNVKNRTHRVTATLTSSGDDSGVLVAQGGRFGGWSLYVVDGHLRYAYNLYGRDLTVVRGETPLTAGTHDVAVEFTYSGAPAGGPAHVELWIDDTKQAGGDLAATTAYYFSFDETLNVGIDRGTPVVDDYPPLHNAFSGTVHRVDFDLAPLTQLTTVEQAQLRVRRAD